MSTFINKQEFEEIQTLLAARRLLQGTTYPDFDGSRNRVRHIRFVYRPETEFYLNAALQEAIAYLNKQLKSIGYQDE